MSELAQVVAQYAAVLLSALAVFLALRAEYRSHRRFQQQLDLAQRNGRPLLHVMQHSFDNEGGMLLYNNGAGVAVVRSLSCVRGNEESRDLVDVLDLGTDITWDEFIELADEFYIQPREALIMVQLTREHLIEQGFAEDSATNMLDQLEMQLDETTITVTYADVFGNVIEEQETLHP
jgi:hypothetical protein